MDSPIFNQFSTSIPRENIRKPDVLGDYRSGTLAENELIIAFKALEETD